MRYDCRSTNATIGDTNERSSSLALSQLLGKMFYRAIELFLASID